MKSFLTLFGQSSEVASFKFHLTIIYEGKGDLGLSQRTIFELFLDRALRLGTG